MRVDLNCHPHSPLLLLCQMGPPLPPLSLLTLLPPLALYSVGKQTFLTFCKGWKTKNLWLLIRLQSVLHLNEKSESGRVPGSCGGGRRKWGLKDAANYLGLGMLTINLWLINCCKEFCWLHETISDYLKMQLCCSGHDGLTGHTRAPSSTSSLSFTWARCVHTGCSSVRFIFSFL